MIFFKGVGWQIAIELDRTNQHRLEQRLFKSEFQKKTFLGLSIFHLNRPSKWGTFDLWGPMFSTNGCSKMTRSLRSLAENRPVERKFDNLCEKLFRPGILRIYCQILNVISGCLVWNLVVLDPFNIEFCHKRTLFIRTILTIDSGSVKCEENVSLC